jgi:hypothetical protein
MLLLKLVRADKSSNREMVHALLWGPARCLFFKTWLSRRAAVAKSLSIIVSGWVWTALGAVFGLFG